MNNDMLFVVGRLFLLLLLVADYAGDPYGGRSPLSRPFSSQDAFCHSLIHRATISQAMVPSDAGKVIHRSTLLHLSWENDTQLELLVADDLVVLSPSDRLRAPMSLQC
jgi:hypothetical protein